MTSPNVGSASVEIQADLGKFAASLKAQVESAFKGLDFDKLIRDSIGGKPIKVPVKPEFDNSQAPKSSPTKPQKVPVEVDPLFDAFRAELKKQTAAAAKDLHTAVPVDADTDGLRAKLGAQLAEIAKQLKLPVPAEPADKAAFQAKLQEQLDEVKARVKARVKVEPDTSAIPEKVKATPVPKVKAEVDPVLGAFQAEVRSQVAALARTVNAKIPVGAETGSLRAELAAQLAEIDRSVKAEIPTEPGSRAEYEAKLKAQLAEVKTRVKQSVPVEADTKGGFLDNVGGAFGKLGDLIQSVPGLNLVASGLGRIGEGLSGLTGLASQAGGSLSSLGAAAGPIGAIVAGLAAAAAGAGGLGAAILGAVTFAIPAITALVGAIGSIPAALAGIGAGAGTLFLGFKGISEALSAKPKTGGGGGAGNSAAQQARQVAAASRQVEAARRGIAAANRAYEASERSLAAAERGVATAQRNLVDAENAVAAAQKKAQQAQQAVNKARQEAADDLIDLNLQLKGSQLSEEEASLAVTDALRELNAVKLTGNIPDIQKADLAYQRAQLTLQEATQSTKELGKQTADANAKGVEGSDKVQQALREQADALDGVHKAQEGVLDAQNGILDAADSLRSAQDGVASASDGIKSATDSLKSAQDGLAQAQTKQAAAGAAAAAQLIRLAPAAQKFVDALKALKPAFEDLRLDVQQRLFQGLDQTVTHLGEAWIPTLKTTLGSYADTFNGFFKQLGSSISTPKFITDIQKGAEGARQGLEKIGTAVAKNLVPALGDLAAAAGPFLANLGGDIAKGIDKFAGFIERVSKPDKGGTSQLTRFFDKASTAMHDIGTTGVLAVQIIGQIIGIITGTTGDPSRKSPLESFNTGLQKVSDWLKDPQNQAKLQKFMDDLTTVAQNAAGAASAISGLLSSLSGSTGGSADSLGQTIGRGIISGIIAGMVFQGQLLVNILIGLATDQLHALMGFLGIHSPSTVYAGIGGNIIEGLINGITGWLGNLGATAGQIFGVVTAPLAGAGSWLVTHGRNAVIGMVNGIGSMLGSLGSRAGQLKTTVQNRLSDAASWLWSHGQNAVIGLINGIGARLGQLGSAARNIASTVIGALGSLYGQALGYGRNIAVGLYNGLAGLGSWLYSKVYSLVQSVIPAPIRAVLGINSPSKVAAEIGAFVGEGLAQGLSAQAGRVQQAAEEIAAKATPQIPDVTFGLGAMADAKLSASLEASSRQQLQLAWAPNATGDQLLKAFQPLINITYQGDVQRAFTGS